MSLLSPVKDVVCHTESHSVCSVAKATESHAGWKRRLAAWRCLTQPLSPGQNRGSSYLSLACEVMGATRHEECTVMNIGTRTRKEGRDKLWIKRREALGNACGQLCCQKTAKLSDVDSRLVILMTTGV